MKIHGFYNNFVVRVFACPKGKNSEDLAFTPIRSIRARLRRKEISVSASDSSAVVRP